MKKEDIHLGRSYWGVTSTFGPIKVLEQHSEDPDLIKVVELCPERPAPQWATYEEFSAWATHEDEKSTKR